MKLRLSRKNQNKRQYEKEVMFYMDITSLFVSSGVKKATAFAGMKYYSGVTIKSVSRVVAG